MSKSLEALQRLFDHNYGEDFYIKAEEDAETIERELEALEVLKKAFHSSSIYTNKLKDSYECGWITEEEFKLAWEVIHDIDNRVRITPVTSLSVNEIKKIWKV